jgi:hypothetical protein
MAVINDLAVDVGNGHDGGEMVRASAGLEAFLPDREEISFVLVSQW